MYTYIQTDIHMDTRSHVQLAKSCFVLTHICTNTHVRLYICTHVNPYICIYVHTRIYIYTSIEKPVAKAASVSLMYVQIFMYVCKQAHMLIYIYMHIHKYTHINICIQINTRSHVQTAKICSGLTHIYTDIHVSVHTYTYTHIHPHKHQKPRANCERLLQSHLTYPLLPLLLLLFHQH